MIGRREKERGRKQKTASHPMVVLFHLFGSVLSIYEQTEWESNGRLIVPQEQPDGGTQDMTCGSWCPREHTTRPSCKSFRLYFVCESVLSVCLFDFVSASVFLSLPQSLSMSVCLPLSLSLSLSRPFARLSALPLEVNVQPEHSLVRKQLFVS